MNDAPVLRPRSRYRTVLNVCRVIWFVTSGLLLAFAVLIGGLSIYFLLARPVRADGTEIELETLRMGIYLAVACGLVDAAIIMYGRKYFRQAEVRITELEQLERRGPRRG